MRGCAQEILCRGASFVYWDLMIQDTFIGHHDCTILFRGVCTVQIASLETVSGYRSQGMTMRSCISGVTRSGTDVAPNIRDRVYGCTFIPVLSRCKRPCNTMFCSMHTHLSRTWTSPYASSVQSYFLWRYITFSGMIDPIYEE